MMLHLTVALFILPLFLQEIATNILEATGC